MKRILLMLLLASSVSAKPAWELYHPIVPESHAAPPEAPALVDSPQIHVFCALDETCIWTGIDTFLGGTLFGGGINPQVGTSYTVVATDENKLLTTSNASAIAVALPSAATTAGFGNGAVFHFRNLGAGTATITPITSTIDGLGSAIFNTGQGADIYSDGTNYTMNQGASGVLPNPQTGTSYTVAVTDRAGYVTFSNASAIAVTLPQAGTAGFGSNFDFITCDIGAGTATITPTTSTISYTNGSSYTSGAASLALTTGQCATVFSDNTNYFAVVRSGGGGSSALSAITAATGTNTIASGNNPQTWNWAQTTDSQDAFTFGETSAATNGTLTNALANQAELHVTTASASTATPLEIDQVGITATTGPPALQIETTWNNASLVGEGILFNATNTSSAAASKLFDFRVGNTAEITGDKSGNLVALTSLQTTATAPACTAGTAGAYCQSEGTAPTNVASSTAVYADSTSHEIQAFTNGATTNPGLLVRRQPSPIHSTGNTASISTATLCAAAAGACNVAGQYHVHVDFIETGTACSVVTVGGVTFTLSYTDTNATAHSHVIVLMGEGAAATTPVMTQNFFFQTSLANAFASGDINISTNGTVIQYATTYTACTTGTGTYQLDASVTRLQ